jgi:hypothetical protein
MACKYNMWPPKINETGEIKGRKNVKKMKIKINEKFIIHVICAFSAIKIKNRPSPKTCFFNL